MQIGVLHNIHFMYRIKCRLVIIAKPVRLKFAIASDLIKLVIKFDEMFRRNHIKSI